MKCKEATNSYPVHLLPFQTIFLIIFNSFDLLTPSTDFKGGKKFHNLIDSGAGVIPTSRSGSSLGRTEVNPVTNHVKPLFSLTAAGNSSLLTCKHPNKHIVYKYCICKLYKVDTLYLTYTQQNVVYKCFIYTGVVMHNQKRVRIGSPGQQAVLSDIQFIQAEILGVIHVKPGIKCSQVSLA